MIDVVEEPGLLILRINREEKRNALTAQMLGQMAEVIEAAQVPTLVLTGAGPVFSAGADLEEVRGGTLATDPAWERLSGAVAGYRGLTIAALNGTAAGGSLGMVLAADLRIAATGAEVFYPVMKMGVLPQPSDPARMASLVGRAQTKRILLGGARLTASEAHRIGLWDEVVPADGLIPRVKELAEPAVARGVDAVSAIKDMIGRA